MPIYTLDSKIEEPKENSLVVCAGTVTLQTVNVMGSGFRTFHKLFSEDKSFDSNKSWKTELNHHLADFHTEGVPLPSYIRLAKQGSYIGAVATVPSIKEKKGLNFKQFVSDEERNAEFINQYQNAVRLAIQDAKALNRPLYIQPLGTRVYGWDPALAGKLFAEVINQEDPAGELDITVPMYDDSPMSNDSVFVESLIENLELFLAMKNSSDEKPQIEPVVTPEPVKTTPVSQTQPENEKKVVFEEIEIKKEDLNPDFPVSVTEHNVNLPEHEATHTDLTAGGRKSPVQPQEPVEVKEPPQEPVEVKEQSQEKVIVRKKINSSHESLEDSDNSEQPVKLENQRQKDLISILTALINKQEYKPGFCGVAKPVKTETPKSRDLKDIQEDIRNSPAKNWNQDVEQGFIQRISQTCSQKKNPVIHFWATPDSMAEFNRLLGVKGLAVQSEENIQCKK